MAGKGGKGLLAAKTTAAKSTDKDKDKDKDAGIAAPRELTPREKHEAEKKRMLRKFEEFKRGSGVSRVGQIQDIWDEKTREA